MRDLTDEIRRYRDLLLHGSAGRLMATLVAVAEQHPGVGRIRATVEHFLSAYPA